MKKILSLILAVFILLLSIIPITHAIQNDNYKFLDGWQPRWIDYPYAMNITTEKGTLSLSGSIYAQYNPMVINYLHYDTPLKWESWYRWLSWWSGIIFVESKKLKPWINKILYTDYNGLYKEYITTDDSSPFWINIYCWENWKCNINPYVWLSYNFPDEYYITEFLRWKIINNENMTLVKDYVIDINSSPDFILYSSIENYNFYNEQTHQDESRIRLSVDVETEPWSGKFRKVTDTTIITAFFPDKIQKYNSLNDVSFELKFFDYTKAYSVWNELLKDDINKIWSFINWHVWNNYEKYSYVFQDYYSFMQNQIFFYLMNFWLSSEKSDIIDSNNPWHESWLNVFQIPKINFKKPVSPTCSFDVFNWISCAVEWLWYFFNNFIYFFVSIFNWIIDFFNFIIKFISWVFNWFLNIFKEFALWIFESIKNFPPIKWVIDTFHPFLKVLYDYFMSYFTPIWDIFTGKTNLQNIAWGNQEYICSKETSNFIIENTTPAGKKPMEALGAFIYFLNPLPPQEGAKICTGLWMKRIEYGKSTILDIMLFNIFVFAGIWFAFIWLRRYN